MFKKPWGLYKFFTNPKESILIVKAYVASNWYLDIKHNKDVKPKFQKKMMWYMDAKMDERYERD